MANKISRNKEKANERVERKKMSITDKITSDDVREISSMQTLDSFMPFQQIIARINPMFTTIEPRRLPKLMEISFFIPENTTTESSGKVVAMEMNKIPNITVLICKRFEIFIAESITYSESFAAIKSAKTPVRIVRNIILRSPV